MQKWFAPVIVAGLVTGLAVSADAAAKKDVRANLTQQQKAEIRAKARAYCVKRYASGAAEVVRVEILSDGRVRCWIRG
ncbi:MAG: hypothetical protein ACT4SY_05700 [Hyphomicrobiales bacterium]